MLMLKSGVDDDVVESDAFAAQSVEKQAVRRLEIFGGERLCAESVLICHHHQLEVEIFGDKCKIADYTGDKLELFERIELIVDRRLHNESAVAVDEKSTAKRLRGFAGRDIGVISHNRAGC